MDRWELAKLLFPAFRQREKHDRSARDDDTDTSSDTEYDEDHSANEERVHVSAVVDERADLVKSLFMRYGHGRDSLNVQTKSKYQLTNSRLSGTLSSNQIELTSYASKVERHKRAEQLVFSGESHGGPLSPFLVVLV